jgi:hypothetical protein
VSNVVRNVLAFLAGLVVGGVVNMAIVMVSGSVIPPPPGADVTTVEGLKASIHLFEPKHFAMPFLAHALGTLAGAALAALLAASHRMKLAIGIGTLNLIGGIAAAAMIPAPGWFIGLDLVAAYLPMAWIGGKLARRT